MGHFPLVNAMILLDKYDLSGDMNSVTIARSQQDLPNDTFSPTKTMKARLGGLGDGVIGMAGLMDLTALGQEEIIHGQLALSGTPVLISYRGATDFNRCKIGKIQTGSYKSGGNVGARAEWSAEGRISDFALVDGNLMAPGVVTGTFAGTARQLGALSSLDRLYAAIHAIAKDTFTSAVFKLQSDNDEAFPSATDRIVFTTISGLTSQFTTLAGPVTDDWWRISCTAFTGTSLTVYPAVGIANF